MMQLKQSNLHSKYPPIFGYGFVYDIDYPRKVCSTIMVKGCNLRCHYCMNTILLKETDQKPIDVDMFILHLVKRHESWCLVSGGEPFLYDNIFNLFFALKRMKIKVAVSTNGSFPEKVKEAYYRGLVDHFLIDIKTRMDRESYSKVVGVDLTEEQFSKIMETIDFLKGSENCYPSSEFRTTICSKFVNKQDTMDIASYLGGNALYVLQPFNARHTLDPDFEDKKRIIPYSEIKSWIPKIEEKVFKVLVRDV